VRLERFALISLNIDVGSAPKDSEMANVRFLVEPSSVGCCTRQTRRREAIPDMDIGSDCIGPERSREVGFVEHGCSMVRNGAISMLCDAVLLGAIPGAVASCNSALISEFEESVGQVLSTLVMLQGLDFCIDLVVRLARSATPFCWGRFLVLWRRVIPH
jgi:hypothetical protein